MIDFTLAIVNWNTKELLKKCLESIAKHSAGFTIQTLILDNASTDGSPEMVEECFRRVDSLNVILVRNDENVGFALGHELLLPYSQGRYHILVNSDIELQSGCLEAIAKRMVEDRRIGILGPKIIGSDQLIQPSCRRLPTLFLQLWESMGLGRLIGGLFNPYHMGSFDHQTSREVRQIMGSFFVIRSSILPQTGFLDTRFFMYYEEVDFCKRVHDKGYTIFFEAEAEVLHEGGGSSKMVRELTIRRTMRSMHHYFRKHRGKWVLLPLFLISAIDTVSHFIFALLTFNHPFKTLKAYLLGLWDILTVKPAR